MFVRHSVRPLLKVKQLLLAFINNLIKFWVPKNVGSWVVVKISIKNDIAEF